LWAVSGYIYTGQASMDMDISMDIHAKSVDMDMDRKPGAAAAWCVL